MSDEQVSKEQVSKEQVKKEEVNEAGRTMEALVERMRAGVAMEEAIRGTGRSAGGALLMLRSGKSRKYLRTLRELEAMQAEMMMDQGTREAMRVVSEFLAVPEKSPVQVKVAISLLQMTLRRGGREGAGEVPREREISEEEGREATERLARELEAGDGERFAS